MKIQIDTLKKTVRVLDNVNLSDLVKALKILLGEDYKEYTFEGEHSVYPVWTNPIYIPYYIPTKPWYTQPEITWTTTSAGVYNLEIQEDNPSNKN